MYFLMFICLFDVFWDDSCVLIYFQNLSDVFPDVSLSLRCILGWVLYSNVFPKLIWCIFGCFFVSPMYSRMSIMFICIFRTYLMYFWMSFVSRCISGCSRFIPMYSQNLSFLSDVFLDVSLALRCIFKWVCCFDVFLEPFHVYLVYFRTCAYSDVFSEPFLFIWCIFGHIFILWCISITFLFLSDKFSDVLFCFDAFPEPHFPFIRCIFGCVLSLWCYSRTFLVFSIQCVSACAFCFYVFPELFPFSWCIVGCAYSCVFPDDFSSFIRCISRYFF